MTNAIKSLFDEKFEMKNHYSREELHVIVDFLRYEIGKVAISIYHTKIGEISRNDVVLGKISFNPRHIIKAVFIEGIISKDILDEFIRIDDEQFFNLIFRRIKDYEEEMLNVIESVKNLIEKLELVK
ncbi:hypothetical protein [Neobacillus mesonae]|uniref:hypothetical protein n=1 Tax=Neobacillus mesonae TaxID=1193713 RepID=UPI00203FF0F8|nr:hypothetical protein [Neobacillus mesonae]MCM3566999.1 hypothetical protein [Neobacillus mesonae]